MSLPAQCWSQNTKYTQFAKTIKLLVILHPGSSFQYPQSELIESSLFFAPIQSCLILPNSFEGLSNSSDGEQFCPFSKFCIYRLYLVPFRTFPLMFTDQTSLSIACYIILDIILSFESYLLKSRDSSGLVEITIC